MEQQSDIKVICLHTEAFYTLIDHVVERLKEKNKVKEEDAWITPAEAKRILNVKSNTTMQKLRDEGKIRYAGSKKNVVYDRASIMVYLEKTAKKPF